MLPSTGNFSLKSIKKSCLVSRAGVEPTSVEPESTVLSIELPGHVFLEYYTIGGLDNKDCYLNYGYVVPD